MEANPDPKLHQLANAASLDYLVNQGNSSNEPEIFDHKDSERKSLSLHQGAYIVHAGPTHRVSKLHGKLGQSFMQTKACIR